MWNKSEFSNFQRVNHLYILSYVFLYFGFMWTITSVIIQSYEPNDMSLKRISNLKYTLKKLHKQKQKLTLILKVIYKLNLTILINMFIDLYNFKMLNKTKECSYLLIRVWHVVPALSISRRLLINEDRNVLYFWLVLLN